MGGGGRGVRHGGRGAYFCVTSGFCGPPHMVSALRLSLQRASRTVVRTILARPPVAAPQVLSPAAFAHHTPCSLLHRSLLHSTPVRFAALATPDEITMAKSGGALVIDLRSMAEIAEVPAAQGAVHWDLNADPTGGKMSMPTSKLPKDSTTPIIVH